MHLQRIGSSTVPRSYGYVPVQSSIRRALLQSSFSSAPALHFRAPQLPTWVYVLSRLHPTAPNMQDDHRLTGVIHGFRNRSTTSAVWLARLFHHAASYRTPSRSGVYPLHAAFSLHQTGYAHVVEHPHAHLQAGCHVRAPRLRRFPPQEAAVLRFGV